MFITPCIITVLFLKIYTNYIGMYIGIIYTIRTFHVVLTRSLALQTPMIGVSSISLVSFHDNIGGFWN